MYRHCSGSQGASALTLSRRLLARPHVLLLILNLRDSVSQLCHLGLERGDVLCMRSGRCEGDWRLRFVKRVSDISPHRGSRDDALTLLCDVLEELVAGVHCKRDELLRQCAHAVGEAHAVRARLGRDDREGARLLPRDGVVHLV